MNAYGHYVFGWKKLNNPIFSILKRKGEGMSDQKIVVSEHLPCNKCGQEVGAAYQTKETPEGILVLCANCFFEEQDNQKTNPA